MALTMKELDVRLGALEIAMRDSDEVVTALEDEVITDEWTNAIEARLTGLELVSYDTVEGPTEAQASGEAVPIPEWGYDVLRGLIEALNSVRLARAQELEFELSAKYFPEGVESSPYPGVVHTTGE